MISNKKHCIHMSIPDINYILLLSITFILITVSYRIQAVAVN